MGHAAGCAETVVLSSFSIDGGVLRTFTERLAASIALPGALVLAVPEVENHLFEPSLAAAELATSMGVTLVVQTLDAPSLVDDSPTALASAIRDVASRGLPSSGIAAAHGHQTRTIVGDAHTYLADKLGS
jgi:hypothetical protein